MESSDEPTSLQSICHLHASELFPKPANYDCEDASLTVPFVLLSGEYIVAMGHTSDGMLALSNYRVYLQHGQGCYHVPLGVIENLEVKELFHLHISCKDGRSISCTFKTNEHCLEWFKRLHKVTYSKRSIEDMFAFAYYAWSTEERKENPRLGKDVNSYQSSFDSEVERLKFNLHGTWRISQINKDYRICPSYPPLLLVPACITDEHLTAVAKFRSSRRIPAVVWRHVGNGAVIARCSQPEVGWLGWRGPEDEDLLLALSDACFYDRGETTMIDSPVGSSDSGDVNTVTTKVIEANNDQNVNSKKVLIVDARSYTTAVANRARGGGCECPEYYPNCEIQFMNLPNIHSIRKSFHMIRALYASEAEQSNNTWLTGLENTRWLHHMSGLMRAAVTVASAVERDGRPVLVHCSDGWDRTPQVVALAQILLDPYYRTMEGFKVLCEREWLDFGHKFADRCGQSVGSEDGNERCPVFVQWLDCVHQLTKQFECSFEMSSAYLVKLAQHTYSQLFGTFLCNTRAERLQMKIRERTFSVWPFLNSPNFRNHLYYRSNQVLWPNCNLRDLRIWTELYQGTVVTPMGINDMKPPSDIEPGDSEEPQGQMTKTRSYGDLIQVQDHTSHLPRRLSDPSISIEKKFDSISFDSESDKVEINNDSNKPQVVSNNFEETEPNKNLLNGEANKVQITTSTESSTDTIIPNGDLIIAKDNAEKDSSQTTNLTHETNTPWLNPVVVNHNSCNRNEGSDVSEISAALPSQTPSSIYPGSPINQDITLDYLDRLDEVDGLPFIHNEVQLRIQQILLENKLKIEALKKEVHMTRMALLKQMCNHNADAERVDDIGSLPDSVGSAGDHGESLPSDMSWEALDEPMGPTLWVPDHAVNRCMGCDTEFWLGRRKHHCRNCGKIFCADCSENSTPLPSEQLYNPVRVCSGCFSRLHHHTNSCQCTNRNQGKLLEFETEPVPPPPMPLATTNNFPMPLVPCHRSTRKSATATLGKEGCCESFQLVQQKQNQQPPIVEASSAN